jgi:hypothetical protein
MSRASLAGLIFLAVMVAVVTLPIEGLVVHLIGRLASAVGGGA